MKSIAVINAILCSEIGFKATIHIGLQKSVASYFKRSRISWFSRGYFIKNQHKKRPLERTSIQSQLLYIT